MEKDTFIIRTEWQPAIKTLDTDAKAELLDALFDYHTDNQINLKNPMVKLVWLLIEPNLKYNASKYDKRKQTSQDNGKKGGRPRKKESIENLKQPTGLIVETQKPNESLIVIDTVIEPVSVSEPVFEIETAVGRSKPPQKKEAAAVKINFEEKFKEDANGFQQKEFQMKIFKLSEQQYQSCIDLFLIESSSKFKNKPIPLSYFNQALQNYSKRVKNETNNQRNGSNTEIIGEHHFSGDFS